MYKSPLDPQGTLQFPFDPMHLYHRDDQAFGWPEFPFKRVLLARVMSKFPGLSIQSAAGALLMGCGDEKSALFHVMQHTKELDVGESVQTEWEVLAQRFEQEKHSFYTSKKQFFKAQAQHVREQLEATKRQKQEQAEKEEYERWKQRQIIKRYDNGSKYDGEGIMKCEVLIPHGQGTLWIPATSDALDSSGFTGVKRVLRYSGMWMDGMMHGHGIYYWKNGDSWEGTFLRDEMHGMGLYTFGNNEPVVEGEATELEKELEEAKAIIRAVTPGRTPGDDINFSSATARSCDKVMRKFVYSKQRKRRFQTQRIRFYNTSQHVCWGDELIHGRHITVYDSIRHLRDPSSGMSNGGTTSLQQGMEYVILRYDNLTNRYQVRNANTENIKWLTLDDLNFCVHEARPITRLIM